MSGTRQRWPRPRRLAGFALFAAALAAALAVGVPRLVSELGGDFSGAPEEAQWLLPPAAQALVEAAYAGLDEGAVVQDYWVTALSLGQRAAGADPRNASYLGADYRGWWRPLMRLRAGVLLDAAGVRRPARADAEYLARLLRLAHSLPRGHRLTLAALDQYYAPSGEALATETALYVDNDYVWAAAQRDPLLVPAVSVHPYRPRALAELARWAHRGVDRVAWLPTLQGIDPASPRLKAYYAALVEYDITLLTVTGSANGLGRGEPAWGNPMRYRAALDAGVRIVMVHCAASGWYPDPAAPGQQAPGYALFLRLLREPAYANQLYGALTGVAGRGRAPGALQALLRVPDLAGRLVYASGYPLPAVDAAIDLAALAAQGFIAHAKVAPLRALYEINPLLFDFVLARNLVLPHTGLRLPAAVFTRTLDAADAGEDTAQTGGEP